MPAYSTVTIDSVEFQDSDGVLNPVPLLPVGLLNPDNPESLINPQDIPVPSLEQGGQELPPTTEAPAFVIAIHATDPLVGPDPPLGPDGQAPPSQALSNIIGLQIRQAGSYDDIEVPVFQTPQVFSLEGSGLQPGQTFPPNPEGDTEVAATLWYFKPPDNGELPSQESEDPLLLVPAPLTDDGTPIQGTATISELDQNEEVPPVTTEELPASIENGEPT